MTRAGATRDIPAPVLRWAGSKRWLVRQGFAAVLGEVSGTYFEPFLGSASVFLAVQPPRAVLSDVNRHLINFYRALQLDAVSVSERLRALPLGSEAYYEVRATFPHTDSITAAAQFLYLNTFCFNGLYRENMDGHFNVPYGRPKNMNLPSTDALIRVGVAMSTEIRLEAAPFAEALAGVRSGDTVYLDPPYVAGHRSNGFVDYNRRLFRWDDQVQLASEFRRLDKLGARVFLSNADHESVLDLYPDMRIEKLQRHSSMAGSAARRGATNEIVVTNQWPS